MGVYTSVRDILRKISKRLGFTVQDETQQLKRGDSDQAEESISFEDMMVNSLASLMLQGFTLPIAGTSQRAIALNDTADDFVNSQFLEVCETAFRTGDCVVIPAWNGRNIENTIIDSDNFVITGRVGKEITGIVYQADHFRKKEKDYFLLVSISYETLESGEGINWYRVFIAEDEKLYAGLPSQVNEEWAAYDEDWYIPGVDRLLVARYKSITTLPDRLNAIKGVPICAKATQPIAMLRYLWTQYHVEFELSEKFVAASKTLFEPRGPFGKVDSQGNRVRRSILPKGRSRVVMEVEATNRTAEGDQPFMQEYAPDIRYLAYQEAIQDTFKLFEKAVGVSEGILSDIDSTNYENVDNVKKSLRKTQAFIDSRRKAAEDFLFQLVYTWDILHNYYSITPQGDYTIQYDWSNDYINTFSDQMAGYVQGHAMGATDPVDYRVWFLNESPEQARERVQEINGLEDGLTSIDLSKLTTTQTTQIQGAVEAYQNNEITRDQALSRIMIYLNRESAEQLLNG